jgi:3-oxoacyl-[acyl-carrier protein] reductase
MINIDLFKKIIIVSGGSGNLGSNLCKVLLDQGATVISIDKKIPRKYFKNKNFNFIKSNLKNSTNIQNVIKKILVKFKKIDVLINCLGIFSKKKILEINEKEIRKILYINFTISALLTKFSLKNMLKKKSGKIINITSIAGMNGGVYAGDIYAASKAALINLTKSIAKKYGKLNIFCNCINSGPFVSQMTKNWPESIKKKLSNSYKINNQGKLGDVKDIASIVLFLCSNNSRMMQGSEINASGGIYI